MSSKYPTWLSFQDTAVLELIHQWEKEDGEGNRKPTEILKKLSEKVEEQYEDFAALAPDPFDDRHPSQSYPECKFGDTLRLIVGEKEFMHKLTTSYFANADDDFELNCQSARLILNILSGLEGKIFEDWESIGKTCYKWGKSGKEPLRTYALDILAVGMQNEENAGIFKEENQAMVPIVLKRLKCLKEVSDLKAPAIQNFGKFSVKSSSKSGLRHVRYSQGKAQKKRDEEGTPNTSRMKQGEQQMRRVAHLMQSSQAIMQGPSQIEMQVGSQEASEGSSVSKYSSQGESSISLQAESKSMSLSSSQLSSVASQATVQESDVMSSQGASQETLQGGLHYLSQGSSAPGSLQAPMLESSQELSLGASQGSMETGLLESSQSSLQMSSQSPSQVDSEEPFKISTQESHASEVNDSSLKIEEELVNGVKDEERNDVKDDVQEEAKNDRTKDEKSDAEMNGDAQQTSANPTWQEHAKAVKDAKNAKAKRHGYKKPSWCMWPLNIGTQQLLLLGYATSLGQYQELLMYAFEYDALDLIFYYINVKIQKDPILALRGLEYLSALMCHKKFVSDFVFRGGVQKLLEIPRQTTPSTGVSICFYYLAYNDDAMERVCLLPHPLLTDLIKYTLWLVDSGMHDSSRCYATLFFSLVFNFRAILDLFVSMDGLRRLINTVTVLSILRPEESRLMANEESFGMRQIIKHTLLALKKFFCSQLSIKADEIRRKIARSKGTPFPQPIPAYKAIPMTAAQNLENVQLLLENPKEVLHLHQLLAFKKLSGVQLLFQIVALAATGWDGYSGRNEVIKLALDILFNISVSSKIQVMFCQNVAVDTDETQSGIRILIRAAEGILVKGDGEIQKLALQVLCNCVCAPKKQINREMARDLYGYHFSHKMWNAVRMQNGIKVLLALLNTKTPITEADEIRCLACKALCGLSRSDRIRQVLHKLIVTFSGQLQMLMREPVLPDKANEHSIFCKYASELIETVTGKALTDHASPMAMLSTLKKAGIVSQTKISYSEKELLQLIADHLKAKGFHKSATTLQKEAFLKSSRSSESVPDASFISPAPSKKRKVLNSHRSQDIALTPGDSTPGTPLIYRPDVDKASERLDVPKASTSQDPNNCFQPTLDTIVTNYLREQHAHCRNPVTTCPEFSLRRPHQCPEPHYKMHAPANVMQRMLHRQIHPRHGGLMGSKLNRKFIYSRFRSVGTIEDKDGMTSFTCATFLPDGDYILLGTKDGEIKMYNIFTGLEEGSYSCHSNPISNCEPSKDLNLLLTSSTFGQPTAALWSFFHSPFFDKKISFTDDNYIKFNTAQDQIIGTAEYTAHIYDLTTGKLSLTLTDPHNLNRYDKNIATFNYTDDLVLNDGCLWDVRAAKLLHKFDKFNDYVSGVFHPSGLEIIISSEIWDIRTYHLLDTCTSLDQCRSIFNANGDIIYGVKHVETNEEYEFVFGPNMVGPYDSAFRTFDSYDYSVIATTDAKKTIFDICPDNNDSLVAVIEGSCNESICRLYEVGRLKKREEDESDEQTEDEENDDINEEDEDDYDDAFDTLENLLLDVGDDDDDDDEDDDLDDDDSDMLDADDFDDDDDDDDEDDDDNEDDDDDNDSDYLQDYDGDDDDDEVEDRDINSVLDDEDYQHLNILDHVPDND